MPHTTHTHTHTTHARKKLLGHTQKEDINQSKILSHQGVVEQKNDGGDEYRGKNQLYNVMLQCNARCRDRSANKHRKQQRNNSNATAATLEGGEVRS